MKIISWYAHKEKDKKAENEKVNQTPIKNIFNFKKADEKQKEE
ncbi:hypothetical protein [Halalkalibacter krulwichiae]|uniref:Uncharacterized protein n=1 Tax=Halalkalibacter krulwichiae TaxID=199441 RepID=A0A1X9MAK9_9BACI|nr:hypothetical protein [Halalkalibacter krulwichiae]ARK30438.1 hypothetical protein BkAM31D_11715 [Halalkalibacter krulwichiae]